jgi:hypothetical protein
MEKFKYEFVNIATGKALKELGYKEKVDAWNEDGEDLWVPAPRVSEVRRWFRENYGWDVVPTPMMIARAGQLREVEYSAIGTEINRNNTFVDTYDVKKCYKTYEQAAFEGVKAMTKILMWGKQMYYDSLNDSLENYDQV